MSSAHPRPAPPLLVIEFLTRISDIIVEYFGSCSEKVVFANVVTIYQVRRLA
jgi:hypothetical protein